MIITRYRTRRPCFITPFIHAAYIINGRNTAIPESTFSNACDAIGNRHRSQTGATFESIISNACDAIGNGYRGQTGAIIESIISNACDAIGNRYRGQTGAILESILSNTGDAIGNGYRGQTGATRESFISNACDAIGNGYRGQTAATIESTRSNARDAIGNGYRGQTGARPESTFSNACYAVGNRHRSQTGATFESIISNACDAIGFAIVVHRGWDNNSPRIIPSANYSCCCSIQLVSNSVNCNRCKRWRVKNCHRHYGNEQRKKFVFHIILCENVDISMYLYPLLLHLDNIPDLLYLSEYQYSDDYIDF